MSRAVKLGRSTVAFAATSSATLFSSFAAHARCSAPQLLSLLVRLTEAPASVSSAVIAAYP